MGYGRSTAAKASAAAKRKLAEQTRKRLDKAAESGIIQEKIRLYNIHNETDVGVFTAEEIEAAIWDKTQEDEVNCRIYEYLHTHDTISDTMISEIVSFVKSEYDDLPEGNLYGY